VSDRRIGLERLCARFGIATDYHDIWGQHHAVEDRNLVALLGAFGIDASSEAAAAAAEREAEAAGWRRALPPVAALDAGEATWSVEEYTATFDDDDVKFVGEIDAKNGLFTPALDGPNPSRSGNRNNVGDVWVVATHALGAGAAPMRARAHLVVTVPLYMRWDFASLPR